MRRLALIVVLLIVAVVFAGMPYLTAYRMHVAAENRDHEALSRHIDFDSVRESLRAQLQARVDEEAGRAGDHPLGGVLGRAVGGAVVDSVTRAYVSPEGVAALMRGDDPAPGGPVGERMEDVRVSAGYRSFDRFAVTLTDDPTGHEVVLVLSRRGLGWQLTEIRLPDI